MLANGCMSREEDVISGIPQGTVLAAILLGFMISDIDEDVKMCIIRCFADGTRVNKKIKTNEDKKLMQKDLDAVYRCNCNCNCNGFWERVPRWLWVAAHLLLL